MLRVKDTLRTQTVEALRALRPSSRKSQKETIGTLARIILGSIEPSDGRRAQDAASIARFMAGDTAALDDILSRGTEPTGTAGT